MRQRSDRGSASIWLLCGCALVLLIAYGAELRATAVLARHRAAAAADLAALAAAGRIGIDGSPCSAAAAIAAANGATVRTCQLALGRDRRVGTVSVVVAVHVRLPFLGSRTVTADARAGRIATDRTREGD